VTVVTSNAPGVRVSVIGTPGCGKTATAAVLADRIGAPHIELDALFWGPDWTPVPLEEFSRQVTELIGGPRWVCDGNYSSVRSIVWSRADTVVWLDYPLGVIMRQLLKRTVSRSLRREELWQGNRESFRKAFLSRDSILLYGLRTYRRRKRKYPSLLEREENAHLAAIRLRSPSATREWLEDLAQSSVGGQGE
jgi:adenylate kinase family enzyme